MIRRKLEAAVRVSLQSSPAVGLVGPRQVGKTTLAKSLAAEFTDAIYLDLERPTDLAKLHDPESYLSRHAGSLVILDEAQRMPQLFPVLRALIDDDSRNGRFLVLGSASPDLARQASESLAGRILYHELTGFLLAEIESGKKEVDQSWLRGASELPAPRDRGSEGTRSEPLVDRPSSTSRGTAVQGNKRHQSSAFR